MKIFLAFYFLLNCILINADEDRYVYFNQNEGKELPDISIYQDDKPLSIIFTIPDDIKDGVKNQPGNYLDALVEYLTSWTDDNYLKIKSIHDWICTNIEYDVPAYNKGEIKLIEPLVTLRYRTAVCGGYAMLFNIMAQKAGFEAFYVAGVTKGKSKYAIGPQGVYTRHAWNAVKINDIYYLLDPTWDSGYVNNNRFTHAYTTDFFLTDPELFVRRHFPTAPGWLLTDDEITIEQFRTMK
jgi:hypothetical protein